MWTTPDTDIGIGEEAGMQFFGLRDPQRHWTILKLSDPV
jgi:hypothetical protein